MHELLWLVPALPFAGFILLTLGTALPRRAVAAIGVGSVGLSALIATLVAIGFHRHPIPAEGFVQVLWSWIEVAGFAPRIAFYLDGLSLLMMLVVTGVGFVIHLYSAEFMVEDEGYRRFFAYMNLFVGSMLTLVLADNLLLLYVGWEGVGLCSYLLIGFWYTDPANGRAAQKAFIVTRLGDTAFAIGLFLLFTRLGTLDIQDLMQRASQNWAIGSEVAIAAAALLLGGAVGKSAQLPLQTWLPDAMAGPTPVSALIHAATMVTAGVYLIARTHVLFSLAPPVLTAVGVIGTLTLLLAAFSALAQRDFKRVLAYSTISQIGYMFLALGVGAWSAALFHFMTHAFFKALLFLAAGSVILSLHEEHDIFRMGGLRRSLPVTFWTFLIGAASLAGFPLITAGFYSKDEILWHAWNAGGPIPWLWIGGVVGAFLTAVYSFRLVFRVFFGDLQTPVHRRAGWIMLGPLIVLAALSLVAGFIETPRTLGHLNFFSGLMETALPVAPADEPSLSTEWIHQIGIMAVSLLGIGLAYLLFVRRPDLMTSLSAAPAARAASNLWLAGWGFDRLYDVLVVQPFLTVAEAGRRDVVDRFYTGLAHLIETGHRLLRLTQTGHVRWYAAMIGTGVVLLVGVFMMAGQG